MINYEDDCVGCTPEMGCLGNACMLKNAPHYYCDKCGDEVDVLYELDGEQLCSYCVLNSLDTVN